MNPADASSMPTLAGEPSADSLAQNAYEVLALWNPGHSADFRQMIVLVGVLFAILVLGAAVMLPRRVRVISIVVISIGFTAGIMLWGRAHPPIAHLTGAIRVETNGVARTDRWNVFTSPIDASGTLDWIEGTAPVLGAQAPRLERDAAGRPIRFAFNVNAGQKVAFVTRTSGASSSATLQPVNDPIFEDLAMRCYVSEGFRIVGLDGDTIVVSRSTR